MHEHTHDNDEAGSERAAIADLRAQLAALDAEIARLQGRLDVATGPPSDARSDEAASTSRRSLFGMAGASAVGALGATLIAGGRPVAAADPNDVVKNTGNPVVAATTMTGAFNSPIVGLFNNGTGDNAGGLYMLTQSPDAATVRADNDGIGPGAVAVAANAPGGRDVLARGSGRIAMVDHSYDPGVGYASGELHQSSGTFYAVTNPSQRRVIAAPDSVGALTVIEPRRVYDSRTPAPAPGRISAGESRVISVADARSVDSGAVTIADIVPPDATALVVNLTAINTAGGGFLSLTPAPTQTISASTLNWIGDAAVANFSVVGLIGGRQVRVHCGGSGSTDFALDVLGYHR